MGVPFYLIVSQCKAKVKLGAERKTFYNISTKEKVMKEIGYCMTHYGIDTRTATKFSLSSR